MSSVRIKGLVKIDDNAFNGCSSLQTLHAPKALESVGSSAFLNCRVYFGGTLAQREAVDIYRVGNGHLMRILVTISE